ncbi:hypothetical protein GCM10011579_065560 [Streptomyces albiflavescens]|uniref:Transposase n=1 Tax=Streptomyces albiflavescens TaxID=1623582 RepID=A0A917YA84_9ACTN|nr:hypothetical protein GCM10011579_065560 [Streptomyces albiflavescens]
MVATLAPGISLAWLRFSRVHDLPHPEYGRNSAAKPARYLWMMARRKAPKGRAASKACQAAKRQAANGLRTERSENRARTAPFDTNLRLHRVRSRLAERQELRRRDAGPGWSDPGWC